jgi:hypothetical protein
VRSESRCALMKSVGSDVHGPTLSFESTQPGVYSLNQFLEMDIRGFVTRKCVMANSVIGLHKFDDIRH